MRKIIFILFFILFTNLFSKEIVIYVNSHLDKQFTIDRWKPTIDLLNKKIPEHRFKLLPIPPTQLDKIKNLLDNKKIDFIITQPAITTELIFTKNIAPMLTLANKYHMSEFGSVFIALKSSSSINNLIDIKNKTIVSPAQIALGGWLAGYEELLENGIDPIKDKKVTFLGGNQKKVIESILNGEYDIGVIRTGMLEKLSSKGIIDISKLKVINEKKTNYPIKISTKLYPEWSLSRTEYLDIHLANKVFKVFNEIKPTDKEAIIGEYYHWHLPQSHKQLDILFRKLNIGHYKDLPKYDTNDLIKVAVITTGFLVLLGVLLSIFLKYKYTKRLKDELLKSLKLQEKEIDKLHNRLFLAADNALAGYWEWHIDSDYLYLSKGWKRFLGYEENELENVFETFVEHLHPDDVKTTMNIANNYIKTKKGTYKTKFRLKHKDGTYKWVSVVGAMSQNGENIFFGFHIDIDDLTTTKETLIAQSKSAMMGEMIGAIAHQFKQPLSIISMTSSNQIASIELEEKITNKMIIKDANENLKQVLHLSETIDTFRDFLKPNRKKTNTTIESIIESSLSIVNKSLKNNDIEVLKNFSKTNEIKVYNSELMQVFINLLNNSKDAFKINNIEKRVITINTIESENSIITIIEDTAGGIPTDKIDNIFNVYFTTKEDTGGTGLGLYIVKTIIEEHYNGSIEVKNIEHGVKFTISLPLS